MAFQFTEQHAMSLVMPHLQPGEEVLHRGRGVERPWWTRLFSKLGSLFWRYYLVVATSHRLLLIRHKGLLGGYGEKSFEALPWGEIESAQLKWGIFEKPLVVTAHQKRWKRNIVMGRFWMKRNFQGGEGIVATWQAQRGALPGAPIAKHLAA